MPVKINLKTVMLYCGFAFITVIINKALEGVPLSLGLFFSLLICGGNALACTLIYLLSTVVNLNLIYSLCGLFEGAFLLTVTLIYRRANKKIKWEALIYLLIALSTFITFSSWSSDLIYPYFNNAYLLRGCVAAVICAFTFFCFKAVYCALFRLYRCKLREDEIVCFTILFTVAGVGFINFFGSLAFCLLAAALITLTVKLFKSPTAVICAIIVGVPPTVLSLNLNAITGYTLICVCALLFVNTGKFSAGIAVALGVAAFWFFNGFYDTSVTKIVIQSIILCGLCLICSLPSDKKLSEIYDNLYVKKALPQTIVNVMREQTGERLFKISEVFREIERAFSELDEVIDDNKVKAKMLEELKRILCKNCEISSKCKKSAVYVGFNKLINVGCIKGKVSLIDLPSDVTLNCKTPAEVINALNFLLAEYRRATLDAENAKAGRRLLANQAKGVSCVLKNCAVDLCRALPNYKLIESKLISRLASEGISCSEIYVQGEENLSITAVICGNQSANKAKKVICSELKKRLITVNKTQYDGFKYVLYLKEPPKLDAAFGVACMIKSGEKVSGDTHSVIKINEHGFLAVLSDGMGSGEYANKVSSTAISLIEAFYRAEMPEGTVLETINKLLSFNRDERFACIDIAQINLNDGRAEFIKIGSPIAVIMRAGEIKILESSSLPLGILDNLHPTVLKENLKAGDVVVFMSDGITSAFPSTTELYDFLQTLKPLNPQTLADNILKGALVKTDGVAQDDMTVLCVRIFNACENDNI